MGAAGVSAAEVDTVVCDLNGESYRAREWSFASLRAGFPETLRLLHPADCLGDVGVAAGALLLGLASSLLREAGGTGKRYLVFAGAETGERAAAVLVAPHATPPPPTAPSAPASALSTHYAGILREHFDELAFLLVQRRKASRSPDYTGRAYRMLVQRAEAHVQGLLNGGQHLPALATSMLAGGDADDAAAATYALLRLGTAAAEKVVTDRLVDAEGDVLAGICAGLRLEEAESLRPTLHRLLSGADAARAAAAAEVLAFHAPGQVFPARLDPLLKHDDPAVRRVAWRAVAHTGVARPMPTYQGGLRDPDPSVRNEVLTAAVFAGQAWVLEHCRQQALATPSPEQVDCAIVLGVLAKPADLPALRQIGKAEGLGPRRFDALSAYGHPQVVDLLIAAMSAGEKDPGSAASASRAFEQITGVDVTGGGEAVVVMPPGGTPPDEVDVEFLEEVYLPNAAAARSYWDATGSSFAAGTRWCRGIDVSAGWPSAGGDPLDMRARWQSLVRARYEGTRSGTQAALESMPR